MAKIYFETVGCRLNQAESERMAQGFILAGHEVVEREDDAELRVVNTCTVTSEAGRKSRRAARTDVPGQRVVVTGCHSEVKPDDFETADLRVSNADKERLVGLTLEKFGMDGFALGMEFAPFKRLSLYPLALEHTRAFVKIQDGCNLRCAFCLTTVARGASHSRNPVDILQEIDDLAAKGCQEVVLTGVNAGAFGVDGLDLGGLLKRILEETQIPRLRLSSLEPWNFKYSWMELWDQFQRRLCPHLHMSLQSGSDTVLHRMRRTYDTATYAEKVERLRTAFPRMGITTDLIVGFPGETDQEHQESRAFVERMQFSGAHVFSFSPRPGTDAAGMPDPVSREVKKQRYQELNKITRASAGDFRRFMVGETCSVLWEQPDEQGRMTGLSENYLRVYATKPTVSPNQITEVKILGLDGELLVGEAPAQTQKEVNV